MGFSRQEYWSGVPFPSPGDLLSPGIKPGSPVYGERSHEIRQRLLLGRKAMTGLDSMLKSEDIHIVKALVFPVVTYSCESWTIKKAQHQRLDVFKLWCGRRLLRVP